MLHHSCLNILARLGRKDRERQSVIHSLILRNSIFRTKKSTGNKREKLLVFHKFIPMSRSVLILIQLLILNPIRTFHKILSLFKEKCVWIINRPLHYLKSSKLITLRELLFELLAVLVPIAKSPKLYLLLIY